MQSPKSQSGYAMLMLLRSLLLTDSASIYKHLKFDKS